METWKGLFAMNKIFNYSVWIISVMLLIGGALFLIYYYSYYRKKLMAEQYSIHTTVSFPDVEGLYRDARFRIYGRAMGLVKNIRLVNDRVEVDIHCEMDTKIYKNYHVLLAPRNLAGAYYIELNPGDAKTGVLYPSMQGITLRGDFVPDPITTFSKIYAENSEMIQQIVANLRDISAKIDLTKGTLGKIALNDRTYNLFLALIGETKELVTDYRIYTQYDIHDEARIDWTNTFMGLTNPAWR